MGNKVTIIGAGSVGATIAKRINSATLKDVPQTGCKIN